MLDAPVLITHVVNDAVITGFIPTYLKQLKGQDSKLIVITDQKEAHIEALIECPKATQPSLFYRTTAY